MGFDYYNMADASTPVSVFFKKYIFRTVFVLSIRTDKIVKV